ncbi:MAG: UbiA prenyltransferase family protein [Microthrixaceae bacterium]|nr:UbiA prenyltransferase family protein [Microthrixaceae bacterium]
MNSLLNDKHIRVERGPVTVQSIKSKAAAALGLIRPPFALLVLMFAQLGASQSGNRLRLTTTVTLVTAVAGWILAVVSMNELGDEDVDSHNIDRQNARPLVTGALSRIQMWTIVGTCSAAATVAASLLGRAALVTVLGGLVLGAAYSLPPLRLSRRGPATSLLLPLGYVTVPFMMGAFAASRNGIPAPTPGTTAAGTWMLITGLYVSFLGRLLLKDFRDLEGDMLYGKRTFLVRYGRITTISVSSALWVIGGIPIVAAARSAELAVSYGLGAAVALWLLNRLAGSADDHTDDVLIAAVAAVGRSVLLATIALYETRLVSAPAWAAITLVGGSVALGLIGTQRYIGELDLAAVTPLRGDARRDHVRYSLQDNS